MELSENVIQIMIKEINDNIHDGYACISRRYPNWLIDVAIEYCNSINVKLRII